MESNGIVAVVLLQLIGLAILSVALFVRALNTTDSHSLQYRRFGSAAATTSIGSFVCAGIVVVGFFLTQYDVTLLLQIGLIFIVVGLVQFVLLTGALYNDSEIDRSSD